MGQCNINSVNTHRGWSKGKAYAVAIMDQCSRRILGVVVSWSMQTMTLIAAPDHSSRVRERLPENPLTFHSDQGSQYNAIAFRTELTNCNIARSMSGVGSCHDNAPMESFWTRMIHELREEMMFADLRHARSVVYRWVHMFSDWKGMDLALSNLSTAQIEE